MSIRSITAIQLCFGIFALLALALLFLALTDIGHGESDLSLEWAATRVAYLVLLVATLGNIVLALRVRRTSGT